MQTLGSKISTFLENNALKIAGSIFLAGYAAIAALALYLSSHEQEVWEDIRDRIYNKCISKTRLDSSEEYKISRIKFCAQLANDLSTVVKE